MASIDLLPSEAAFLELVLRNKEIAARKATRIMERAEEDVDAALSSIFERAGVSEIVGKPRLLHGVDGKPAQIAWRDPRPESKGTNGVQHRTDTTLAATETGKSTT